MYSFFFSFGLLVLPLCVGYASSSLFTSMPQVYNSFILPPFAPPASAFGIVWTLIFILMGISAFIIVRSNAPYKKKVHAIRLYFLQLLVNFFWTYIFFTLNLKLFAFFWIVLLFVLVICMAKAFRSISKLADNLLIPYILWLLYAAYLNGGIYLLN